MKELALVRLTQTLSNVPRALERLIDKVGEHPARVPRKKLVHKVTSTKPERRRYKPNRKLSPEEVQKLVAQYEAGATIAALAREWGMHTQTVDTHLKSCGVQKHGSFKLSPTQVDEVAWLYTSGWSAGEIARKFEVTTTTISKSLVRAGVTLRSHRQAQRRIQNRRKQRKN
ncbi:hypothetical protein ABZV58_16480 [Nocardia sp. NPDC004654]|uniref:hypothetical protein n=1 Tax=Nocardia sp. NPDC004654 TaxID=3154776 RepID=UPI0033AB47E7